VPGRRSTIRYWPVASVVTDRTFSMRAGLAASTVTPGRTKPAVSLTTPVIAACARAADGVSSATTRTTRGSTDRRVEFSIVVLLTCLCEWTTISK